jgi:hypothetical protein
MQLRHIGEQPFGVLVLRIEDHLIGLALLNHITVIRFATVRSTGRSWVTKITPDMILSLSISSSISIKIF